MLSWLFRRKNGLPKDYKKRIDKEALHILEQLTRAGFESYLVGGCVRDILLKKTPKDFDIATRATPQQVKAIIRRSFIIGKRFRIVVAKRPHKAEDPCPPGELFPSFHTRPVEKEFQITTFRRAPVLIQGILNENVFGDPKDDALRRDFTINGLFLDVSNGKIVDYIDGLADLEHKKLRMIGHPLDRFKEDPIRILRALRFAARADLKFESHTGSALQKAVSHLGEAKKERVREEIVKSFREGAPQKVFARYQDLGIWKQCAPSLDKFLHKHPGAEKMIEKLAAAVSETGWRDPHNPSPLFYLLLYPFMGSDKELHPLTTVADELKISRKEREDMDRIHNFLAKIHRDPTAKQSNRILVENPKLLNAQIQGFYVLKILGSANVDGFGKIWSAWEKSWLKHLEFIRSIHRSAPAARDRSSLHSRGRPRRRRRTRMGSEGALPSSSVPSDSSST